MADRAARGGENSHGARPNWKGQRVIHPVRRTSLRNEGTQTAKRTAAEAGPKRTTPRQRKLKRSRKAPKPSKGRYCPSRGFPIGWNRFHKKHQRASSSIQGDHQDRPGEFCVTGKKKGPKERKNDTPTAFFCYRGRRAGCQRVALGEREGRCISRRALAVVYLRSQTKTGTATLSFRVFLLFRCN